MVSTEQLNYIRSEIRAEIGLLNNRLNALISSQSFLVIAHSSALGAGYGDWSALFTLILTPALAILGIVLALEARAGLEAAHEAVDRWREREDRLMETDHDLLPLTLASDKQSQERMRTRQHAGARFTAHAPVIFLVAWCVFLVLPFVFYAVG